MNEYDMLIVFFCALAFFLVAPKILAFVWKGIKDVVQVAVGVLGTIVLVLVVFRVLILL
jgi:hypothetical protein